MKKTPIFAAVFASIFLVGSLPFASLAHAQYVAPNYVTNSCVILSAPLTVGSTDAFTAGQVSQLQQFLARYNGLSSTFINGYFGNDTAAAVAQFQAAHGISPVGVVGPLTRAAIQQVSCGGSTYPISPANPIYPTQPTYPTYPYGGTAGIYLNSLSATSGTAGMSLTLYGSQFTQWNNTVHFGTTVITGVSSTGNSLVVTVPSLSTGTYPVYVSNSNGTTNSIQFNLTSNWSTCPYTTNSYNYGNQCGGCPIYNNGYNYNNSSSCYPTQTISLNSLSASQQAYNGTLITAYGNGFTSSGNTVHFDGTTYSNVYSSNGTSLTFTIPYNAYINYGNNQTYPVYIVNGNGATSNTIQFSLNSNNSGGTGTITSVNGPTNVTTGTSGTYTVYLTGNTNQYVTVTANWGDSSGNTSSQQVYVNGNGSVSMSHTYYTAGTYTIQFSVNGNNGSSSNTYPYTVYVNGSNGGGYGSLNISSLSPQQGNVGTTVAIQGNGFSTYGNTVHFGSGGSLNLQSYNNGSVIYYTIPRTVSGCDLATQGSPCAQYIQEITSGNYSIYVTNQNGQSSNTVSYRVY